MPAKKTRVKVTPESIAKSLVPVSKSHLPNRLELGISLALIVVGLGILFLNFKIYTEKFKGGSFTIDNVAPEIVEQVSQKIVYTSEEGGLKDYYSPELDLLLKYQSQKYTLMENVDFISLGLKNRYASTEMGELRLLGAAKVGADINQSFVEKYQKYAQFKVLDRGKDKDLAFIQLTYALPSALDKTKSQVVNRLIYSRKIGNEFVYITFSFGRNFDVANVKEDFSKMLASVALSPQNLEQNLVLEFKEPGVRFTVNRKNWEVVQNPLSAYLYFRNTKLETNPELKEAATDLSIMAYEAQIKADEAYWQKTMAEKVNDIREFRKKDNVKILSSGETVVLGGLPFRKISYQQDGSYGWTGKVTRTEYYGYNEATGYLVEIKASVDSLESEGTKEIAKVLASFEFTGVGKKVGLVATGDKAVLGTASLQIDKSSLVGVTSVVHILNRTCVTAQVKAATDLVNSGGKSYDICFAGTGSGFYVGKDGYIVTNAHVTHWNPEDTMVEALVVLKVTQGFWGDFINDIYAAYQSQGVGLASGDELLGASIKEFYNLLDKGVISLSSTADNYIEGTEPFMINRQDLTLENADKQKKAQLIDAADLQPRFRAAIEAAAGGKANPGITVPDLAILKTEPLSTGQEYPTIGLADMNTITVGQAIQAVGFPAAAEGETLFSVASTTTPTLTRGTISAIKSSTNGSFKLIQIDASISGGNSGGPIVNGNAEVVGVSTYGLKSESGADFNAGVSAEEVDKFLAKNNIRAETGQVSSLIGSGVDNLEKSYYKWAIRDFESAEALYAPVAASLNPLISLSNAKITGGEDKTPFFMIGSLGVGGLQLGLLVAGILVLILGVILIIVFMKKGKEGSIPLPPTPTQAPIPPAPVAPVPPTPVVPSPPMPPTPQA